MGGGLHMLGASGSDGLKNQFIVVKIDRIDADALKRKLAEGGHSAAIAPLVMLATDRAPKAAVDLALPLAVKELREYGVYAKLTAHDVPPPEGRARSEFLPGFVVGAGVVTLVTAVGWGAWNLLLKRIFT